MGSEHNGRDAKFMGDFQKEISFNPHDIQYDSIIGVLLSKVTADSKLDAESVWQTSKSSSRVSKMSGSSSTISILLPSRIFRWSI
jgi:hypothetical protein